jgi:hypothetical protein
VLCVFLEGDSGGQSHARFRNIFSITGRYRFCAHEEWLSWQYS